MRHILLRCIYSKHDLSEDLSADYHQNCFYNYIIGPFISDTFFSPEPLTKDTNKQKGRVKSPFLSLSVSIYQTY